MLLYMHVDAESYFFTSEHKIVCMHVCETEQIQQIWIHSPCSFSPPLSLKPQSKSSFFITLTGQINPAVQLSISRRSLSPRRPANSRSHSRLAQRPESELLLSILRKSLCPSPYSPLVLLSAGQSHPSLLSSIPNPLNLSLKHPTGQDQCPAKHLLEVHHTHMHSSKAINTLHMISEGSRDTKDWSNEVMAGEYSDLNLTF